MEKDQKLLGANELPLRQQDQPPHRSAKRSNHAIVAVLLLFVATFWLTTVGPAFSLGAMAVGTSSQSNKEPQRS